MKIVELSKLPNFLKVYQKFLQLLLILRQGNQPISEEQKVRISESWHLNNSSLILHSEYDFWHFFPLKYLWSLHTIVQLLLVFFSKIYLGHSICVGYLKYDVICTISKDSIFNSSDETVNLWLESVIIVTFLDIQNLIYLHLAVKIVISDVFPYLWCKLWYVDSFFSQRFKILKLCSFSFKKFWSLRKRL